MTFLILGTTLLVLGGTAFLLTGALRRYALARGVVDVPNGRSSHSVPTPRGGGLAVVLTFLGALPVLAYTGALSAAGLVAILGAGGAVAAVGFLDDHRPLSARSRLLVYFAAAAWALGWLGGLPPLPFFGGEVDLAWAGHLAALVFLVWMINLYNFMDGIDGLAGIEAVTVCMGAALIALLTEAGGVHALTPLLLLAAVTGFLAWNVPRARIFMGDAGSGFLGIVFGVLALHAAGAVPELFWAWLILLGAFIVDSTVTLLRRAWRRQVLHQGHRTHAYQHAARACGAHLPVALVFGAVNLVWLLPMAALVSVGRLEGALGVAIAYTPLVGLALRFRAGAEEPIHRHDAGTSSDPAAPPLAGADRDRSFS